MRSENLRARRMSLVGGISLGALLFLLGIGWFGVQIFQALRYEAIRCYKLEPPLTVAEKQILEGGFFDCSSRLCRQTVRLGSGYGLTCYTPRLLPITHCPTAQAPDMMRRSAGWHRC